MPNEGMPINGTDTKGRLIVRFHIMFPKYIPQEKKESLIGILS
jgi:DnaJ-class molecular chaperone